MTDPLRATSIYVARGRMRCELAFSSDAPRDTTPALMRRVVRTFPTLPDHACVNEVGNTFGCVMGDTPMPHLVEHLVIDLQVRSALAGRGGAVPNPVYVGMSEWIDERAGTALVEVSFTDDLVALAAFRDAIRFVNSLLAHAPAR